MVLVPHPVLTHPRTNGDPGWEDLDSRSDPDLEALMVRIVYGDQVAVTDLAGTVEGLEDRPVPLLSAHTITVSIAVAPEFDDVVERRADRSRR